MARWREIKQGKIPKEEMKTQHLESLLAPLSIRVKAFITDTFMLLMPLMYIVFYLVMGSREEFADDMVEGWLYIFVPHFFITLGFWFFKGQTPGYRAYSIKVVDLNLQRPSVDRLVIRYFVFGLSLLSVVALFLPLARKDRRSLHDLISKTIPIRVED